VARPVAAAAGLLAAVRLDVDHRHRQLDRREAQAPAAGQELAARRDSPPPS
jgi:hypothetical protein